MIDLHTHTLHSDGSLLPSELVQRAMVIGLDAIAITDHVDGSNIDQVLSAIIEFCSGIVRSDGFTVVPGVEITHVPPTGIRRLVEKARRGGAKIVVVHGETIVEPVHAGTNMAAIEAGADILAHPGLITEEECRLASKKAVLLEITGRKGHAFTNGHVASMAIKHNVGLVLNSDAHAPGDLLSIEQAKKIALGAGLEDNDYRRIIENARALIERAFPR
ncbi:MAG: histidinol phosphate phosphatase domain-containing protein [Deltaproteobacteria bacterium]|nr:histidinol phosphate phosphatase domain-containing protein [Deltaproteobacteria bacterium]